MQRLTYNTSRNSLACLGIDKNDKLFLVYQQWWWDPWQQPYRDTLFLMTKEKDGEWSQPERISKPSYEMVSGPGACAKYVGYDPQTGMIHIFYDCVDSVYGGILYYTNSSMSNWEPVKTDSGPDRVYPRAIEFDTLGNIHLLWNVGFDSIGYHWYRVMYANNSTGEWVKQQVSPTIWLGYFGGTGASYFGVQKNGTAHIVYTGEPYCDTQCVAFYVRNDGLNSANWISDTVPKPSRPLWGYGVGGITVDINDKIHLITGGCTIEYCGPSPGHERFFYYHKQVEDSIWQGPELIPDSSFTILFDRLFIDKVGIPCLIEQDPSTYYLFFTSKKQEAWEQPYKFFDDTLYYINFQFVIDTQGRGQGAYETYDFSGYSDEIWYFGPPNTSVQDTSSDHGIHSFQLFQNYPNPFNSSTIITYEIERRGDVTLKIYDILGREVRSLVNTPQKSGNYPVIWDGKNNQGKEVGSGIYFYQLRVGDYKNTRKLVLIK